ncbi:enoyl-CoA hydratase-related protein [Neobacillus niacini]|uniref:enoyl-CoA hydratase/isomerase family protein n=1 Tax=Neobacillus niacini TaxID=86668 RepID=UPI0007AB2624|nr:enoyl-CoA hydratase-related protein [Neobacillus niacini]MEC1524981.1 enoyl-CoA hydratase-related protein [Neobacillus niacini]
MSFKFHKVHQKEKYAIIQIDNPPVNALSDEVKHELQVVLESLKDNNHVIILTGTGEKTFVAGADIKELAKLNEESGRNRVNKSRKLFSYIENYPIPIIAAINASALGGGFEIAMCCDICIATQNAKFGLPEVGLGVIPGGGGTQRLPKLVSPGLAKLMIYTGKLITSDEAEKLGIIQMVVNQENLLNEAEKIAKIITKKAPLAVQYSKISINQGINIGLIEGLNKEGELFSKLCSTIDKNEGVSAFLEKRKPTFNGK